VRTYRAGMAHAFHKACREQLPNDSLGTRLILDVNRAKDVVLYTIGQVQELVAGFRALCACT
jgi:hypothetical protein